MVSKQTTIKETFFTPNTRKARDGDHTESVDRKLNLLTFES